ncbi:hypothetical protein [Alicyclobacillus fastidiosus]|uniref:hypothetical protein n=1 Tax=Alicyclobacillus fastidiosus TaxID=392011 RepID=UPI0023E97869|nr:hypothetical protein [Alicyclobacillus fastidiosus]GMA59995.1 hypothetical protein GCM10025859_04350 [Alicyclobacillus fastidiosus]
MAEAAGGHRVKTIGPDGKLRVVEGMAPAKPESAAKIVADKLHVDYNDDGSNAQMKASDAGRIGGNLGGLWFGRWFISRARRWPTNMWSP